MPRGFEQAKKAALHFLGDEVRPSDEVGIVSYSLYKGRTLHEYFTTDHQKVREVVEGFSQKNVLVLLSRIPKDLFGPPGKGQSEVVTLVFDGRKNIVSFKRATVDLAGIAQPASCHYTYSLLPPGDYDCRIVVRNLETGETAVARESVLVPGASDAPSSPISARTSGAGCFSTSTSPDSGPMGANKPSAADIADFQESVPMNFLFSILMIIMDLYWNRPILSR